MNTSAIYDHQDLENLGFDPTKVHVRVGEVMALFQLLAKLEPNDTDAVKSSAWRKSRELLGELRKK